MSAPSLTRSMNTRAAHHRPAPFRYGADPQYEAVRREIQLCPFPGQPSKYAGSFFLPDLVVKRSGIPDSGFGLFLLEDVYPGQVLTMYSKIIISEKTAKILKNQVYTPTIEKHMCPAEPAHELSHDNHFHCFTGESPYSCEPCILPLPGFQTISSTRLRLLRSPP